MDILFFLLFLLSFVAIIIGLIKPTAVIRWGNPDKRNRKKVLKFYGIGLIIFLGVFVLSVDNIDATEDYTGTTNISENEDVEVTENNIKEEEPSKSENETNESEAIKEINNDTVITGNLEVHFIDVGQADSILIKTDSDSMLIDAGNNGDSDLVVDYIKSQGIDDLDYVIGTHPHEDHIGGLDAVINSFEISKVLMPKQISTTKTFEDVLTSIQNKGLKITTPKVGATYNLGQAEWTILAPNQEQYDETNNSSIVIRLEYDNNSFIFTGDAEEASELEILKTTGNLKSNVLKAGHHGSSSSTSVDFLNKVNPTYAVISVGLDNSYGHPNSEIIERLTNKNIEILRTDELGTIILTSDGNNISYTANKSNVVANKPVKQTEKEI
ncbi:MAG: ComEC/Rec2 family competence protein [Vulcanibacillus sp.]